MSQARDTALRLLALLRLVPLEPRRIATSTLHEKLRERGFSVSLRTVQRDLLRLSGPFPLMCDESVMPHRWSLSESVTQDLRDIDAPIALALHMAEDHLQMVLPQEVLDVLAPHFHRAQKYLAGMESNELAQWLRQPDASSERSPAARISTAVWQPVAAAILARHQLDVQYSSGATTPERYLRILPCGLVTREGTSYLLAREEGQDQLHRFALHRIAWARPVDAVGSA